MRAHAASRASSTPRAAASTATSASSRRRGPRAAGAGLDLRREQAGRRGADRVLLPHVRTARLRVPVRQRRRPAPDPRRRLRLRPPAAATTRRGSTILGDGTQSKSYIHVDDVVDAVLHGARRRPTRRSRPSTSPPATTSPSPRSPSWRWSARARPGHVAFEYTGGDRGWKGDVPIVRLDTERIRALGWTCARGLARGARAARCAAMLDDADAGPAVVSRAGRPSSSTATACSTRAIVVDGRPHPPRDARRARAPARRRGGLPRAARRRLRPRRRHQPARHRARARDRRATVERHQRRLVRRAAARRRRASARTTTPTGARAASRARACCSTRPRRSASTSRAA